LDASRGRQVGKHLQIMAEPGNTPGKKPIRERWAAAFPLYLSLAPPDDVEAW